MKPKYYLIPVIFVMASGWLGFLLPYFFTGASLEVHNDFGLIIPNTGGTAEPSATPVHLEPGGEMTVEAFFRPLYTATGFPAGAATSMLTGTFTSTPSVTPTGSRFPIFFSPTSTIRYDSNGNPLPTLTYTPIPSVTSIPTNTPTHIPPTSTLADTSIPPSPTDTNVPQPSDTPVPLPSNTPIPTVAIPPTEPPIPTEPPAPTEEPHPTATEDTSAPGP